MKDGKKSKEQLIRELAEARQQVTMLEQYASAYSQVEEELRKREEWFRLHFDNIRDVVYSIDRSYRISNISPSVERFLGYRPDELIGKAFPDLNILTSEFTEQAFLDIERIFGGGQIPSSIYEFVAKDGARIFADVSGAPLRVDGHVIGVVSVAKDITERKRSEENLRRYKDHLKALVEERTAELREVNSTLKEREAKYRFLTEKMNDVIWTADLDMNCTYCSPSVEKVFGYTVEERMKQSVGEIMTPGSYARVIDTFTAEIEREKDGGVDPERIVKLELELYHKEGWTLWMECEISAIRNAAGDLVGLYGTSRDVTDRKKAEEELLKSEAKYRFLTEEMNDIVWTMDMDLNTTYISPSSERVFGFPIEERMKHRLDRMLTPESYAKAMNVLAAEIERDRGEGVNPKRSVTMVMEYYHRNGSTVWIECVITAIRNAAGDLVGIHGLSRDITARRLAEEELKKHRDHLDELVRERTAELTKAYEQLERENAKRKATEVSLRAREKELEKERLEVSEMNSALKVLLKQRDKDKVNIREDVASNIKISVLPLLEKLGSAPLIKSQKEILSTAKSRLNDIASPFVRKISSGYLRLTPNEIKVAYLIKEGKNSKEIAELLNVSLNTVNTHRYNIREKTGLRSRKMNLAAYLQSLE